LANLKNIEGKTVSASNYYYDCPPDTWDEMLYKDAIKDRAERAQALYFRLYTEMMADKNWSFENQVRLHKVTQAAALTRKIADERNLAF